MKDSLTWTMNGAEETLVDEFRDPVNDGVATHRVCIYDGSGQDQPLAQAEIPPMSTCGAVPCWKAAGTKGFKYRNPIGTPDGVTVARLRAGDAGKTKLQVKARGLHLSTPSLPLSLPVTVQYVVTDGTTTTCFENVFTQALKNESDLFKAKGP